MQPCGAGKRPETPPTSQHRHSPQLHVVDVSVAFIDVERHTQLLQQCGHCQPGFSACRNKDQQNGLQVARAAITILLCGVDRRDLGYVGTLVN